MTTAERISAPNALTRAQHDDIAAIRALPATQQPDWAEHPDTPRARDRLESAPALVTPQEIDRLGDLLAQAALGRVKVLQAGDCAEDPSRCAPAEVASKVALLAELADVLSDRAHRPVVAVGRIAGQFAKPRSRPLEHRGSVSLPSFRGHAVNGPEFDPAARAADPNRLLSCYETASSVVDSMRALRSGSGGITEPIVWTSHEALLLDYEVPMLRTHHDRLLLSSTHWPWLGDRTHDPDGAHVRLLAAVANPVACKVGPDTTPEDLLALCARLDPARVPGRLTLISRLGAGAVERLLPPLVRAVREAGHPVLWLCDPMHANTFQAVSGRKSRLLGSLIREVLGFHAAVESAGGTAAGLHLEATPEDVTECVFDAEELGALGDRPGPLCDPRLNAGQARLLTAAWPR